MRFPTSSAALNNQEQRAVVQVATYESIKAKIDRGINRQSEGRKEVAEGLKEMIETKAYQKKYKTIAAFAEHEYGKSARWVSHQLEELCSTYEVDKPTSAGPPTVTDLQDKKEQKALSQVEKAREATPEPEKEEEEKPAVHSADEAKPEPAKPHTNGHQPKQNGKPKTQLPIWKEIEDDLIGKAYRRVDDLNRMCPNPVHHKRLISALKMAHGILDEWRRDTK